MTGTVLVVGSINVDDVLRVARLPAVGETVRATGRRRQAGGKGANQASASAAFGAPTMLVGSVGDDATGDWLRAELDGRGIDTSALRTVPGASGSAHVLVDDRGENTIVVEAGVNAATDTADLPALLDRARPTVVLFQLEIPLDVVRCAIDMAHSRGATIVLNAAPAAPVALGPVDVLVVNETEAETLSGHRDPVTAAVELRRQGAGAVLVTLGSRGALVHDATGTWIESAETAVPVVDTTGAGDVFTGVLCAVLARGDSLGDAARIAVRAATWSVTRAGVAFPRPGDLSGPTAIV